MLSSYEVSQMFAAQNNMFLSQQSYAQQIGPPPPLGAPMLGGHQQQPYNYASNSLSGPGMRGGNSFAGGAMAVGGAAVTAAGFAGNMASMTRLGAPLAPFLDPFSGAIGGFRAAGLMGGIAGAALPLAIGAGASMAAGAFIHGGQQQQMITNQLGQFNFNNQQARGGVGFTRDDASAIGSSVRSLAHIPEMMTSVEELTKLMPKLKSMGVMQGVKDAQEFSNRFKDTVKTIRDVAKVLGTTMEDASEFFAHSRNVGFLGKQAQVQNAMNMQFTMGVTGMDKNQVMGLQQGGANMSLSMGARRNVGARAVTNIATTLGMAQQSGRLKEGELEDITGAEGPEAVRIASQRFAGMVAGIASSTAVGRASVSALTKFDENGHAVGMDDALVKRYRDGGMSVNELKALSRKNMSTNARKLSFVANEQNLAMDFAGKTGPQGITNLLSEAASQRYGDNPDAVKLLLKRYGASEGEADVMQSTQGVGGFEGRQKEANIRRMSEAAIRERTDPSTILRRLKTRIHTGLFGGLESSGAEMFTSLGKMYDDFVDDLVGRHVAGLTKEGSEAIRKAATGANKGDLRAIFSAGKSGLSPDASSGNWFRETEFAARWSRSGGETGRTGAGQYAYNKGMMGSMSPDQAFKLNEGAGNFRGMGGAREAVRSIVDENQVEFDSATHSRRADIVEEGLRQKLAGPLNMLMSNMDKMKEFGVDYPTVEKAFRESLDGKFSSGSVDMFKKMASAKTGKGQGGVSFGDDSFYDIVQAGVAGQNANPGVGFLRGAASAAMGKFQGKRFQYDFSKLGNLKDATQYMDSKAREDASRAARDALDDSGLEPDTRNLLTNNPEARKAVQGILDKDGDITNALDQADAETTVSMLRKKGINVNATDIPALRKAVAETRTKTREGVDIGKHLKTLSDMKRFQDLSAIKDRFGAAASRLGDSLSKAPTGVDVKGARGLQSALSDVVSSLNNGNSERASSSFDQASRSFTDAVKSLRSAKGADRTAIAAALGEFGDSAMDVVSAREKFGKSAKSGQSTTTSKIAEAFRVDEEDVSKLLGGRTGALKLHERDLDKIQELASKEGFGRAAGAAPGKAKDEQMIETLKAMELNQRKSTDVLVALGNFFSGDTFNEDVRKTLHRSVEGAGADPNGQSKVGGQ